MKAKVKHGLFLMFVEKLAENYLNLLVKMNIMYD